MKGEVLGEVKRARKVDLKKGLQEGVAQVYLRFDAMLIGLRGLSGV